MDSGRVSPTSYLWPFGVLTSQCATNKLCWSKIYVTPFKTTSVWMFPTLRLLETSPKYSFFFHFKTFGKPAEGYSFTVKMGEQSNWKKSQEWGQSAAGIASAQAAWKFWLPKGLQSSRAFQELPGNANDSFWSKSKMKFWGDYIKNLIQCEVPVGGAGHRLWIFSAAPLCPYFVHLKNNRSEEVTTGQNRPGIPVLPIWVGMMVFGFNDLGELLQP